MQYAILLQQRPDGKYQASVPIIPGLTLVGDTRDETLQAVRRAIVAELQTTELVYIDLPTQVDEAINPWLATAGMFGDDPTLEPMLQAIYADRDAE
jgi:predicted RNase H-like HicB family nuclease